MHYSNNYHIAVETAIERNLLLREASEGSEDVDEH